MIKWIRIVLAIQHLICNEVQHWVIAERWGLWAWIQPLHTSPEAKKTGIKYGAAAP